MANIFDDLENQDGLVVDEKELLKRRLEAQQNPFLASERASSSMPASPLQERFDAGIVERMKIPTLKGQDVSIDDQTGLITSIPSPVEPEKIKTEASVVSDDDLNFIDKGSKKDLAGTLDDLTKKFGKHGITFKVNADGRYETRLSDRYERIEVIAANQTKKDIFYDAFTKSIVKSDANELKSFIKSNAIKTNYVPKNREEAEAIQAYSKQGLDYGLVKKNDNDMKALETSLKEANAINDLIESNARKAATSTGKVALAYKAKAKELESQFKNEYGVTPQAYIDSNSQKLKSLRDVKIFNLDKSIKADREIQGRVKVLDEKAKALLGESNKLIESSKELSINGLGVPLFKDDGSFNEEGLKKIVPNQANQGVINQIRHNLTLSDNYRKAAHSGKLQAMNYLSAQQNKNLQDQYVSNWEGFLNNATNAYRNAESTMLSLATSAAKWAGKEELAKLWNDRMLEQMYKPPLDVSSDQELINLIRQYGDPDDYLKSLGPDPLRAFNAAANMTVSSMLLFLPQMISASGAGAGISGTLAALGTLAVTRNPALARQAFMTGASTGSRVGAQYVAPTSLEYSTSLIDAIRKKYPTIEEARGKDWWNDKEIMDEALRLGVSRGIPITGAGAMFNLLSKKFAPLATASKARRVGQTLAVGAAIAPVIEGAGEAAAQYASVGELDWKDIIDESVGSLGSSTVIPTLPYEVYSQLNKDYYINLADKMAKSPSFLGSMEESMEQIRDWTGRMKATRQITDDVERQIMGNMSAILEARKLLTSPDASNSERAYNRLFGTKSAAEERLSKLLLAQKKMEETPKINRELQKRIQEEIDYTVTNGKPIDKQQAVNLTPIIGSEGAMYKIGDTLVTRDDVKEALVDKEKAKELGLKEDFSNLSIENDKVLENVVKQVSPKKVLFQQPGVSDTPSAGKTIVFHGGTLDKDGNIYVSPSREQAAEYAKMSKTSVMEFEIDPENMAKEDEVRDAFEELGLQLPEGYNLDELFLYEALDPRLASSLKKEDIKKLYDHLKQKGYEGISFIDEDILGKDRKGVSNYIVFAKESLKPIKRDTPKASEAASVLGTIAKSKDIFNKIGEIVANWVDGDIEIDEQTGNIKITQSLDGKKTVGVPASKLIDFLFSDAAFDTRKFSVDKEWIDTVVKLRDSIIEESRVQKKKAKEKRAAKKGSIISGDEIAASAVKMGTDDGFSEFTLKRIAKEDYTEEEVSIEGLLMGDPSLKEYVDAGQLRAQPDISGETKRTRELPKSNKEISEIIKALFKGERDALENVLFNWDGIELVFDEIYDEIKFKGYVGRDRQFSRGAEGGTRVASKKEFLRWLMSDEPNNVEEFGEDAEWISNINKLRAVVDGLTIGEPAPQQQTEATVGIPPIVSSNGDVIDGYNRILQAIMDGKDSIKVLKGIPKEAPIPKRKPPMQRLMEAGVKAGISAKNITDLYNVNRDVFGLNISQSIANSIVMDRMMGAMAKRKGVSKDEIYKSIKFQNVTEEFIKTLSEESKPLFQMVGKNAKLSAQVFTQLDEAKKMMAENTVQKLRAPNDPPKYSALDIKLRTGWEFNPVDNKWRYEIDYGKAKDISLNDELWSKYDKLTKKGYEKTTLSVDGYQYDFLRGYLSDFLDNQELFDAYPNIKDVKFKIKFAFTDVLNNVPITESRIDQILKRGFEGSVMARAKIRDVIASGGEITLDLPAFPGNWSEAKRIEFFKDFFSKPNVQAGVLALINHEVQHLIQQEEGFIEGSNVPDKYRGTKGLELLMRRSPKQKAFDNNQKTFIKGKFIDDALGLLGDWYEKFPNSTNEQSLGFVFKAIQDTIKNREDELEQLKQNEPSNKDAIKEIVDRIEASRIGEKLVLDIYTDVKPDEDLVAYLEKLRGRYFGTLYKRNVIPYQVYYRVAGEAEARTASDRGRMPADVRQRTLIADTLAGVSLAERLAFAYPGTLKFQGPQGAVAIGQDASAVIYAISNPNVTTPLHELAHVFESYLTEKERKAVMNSAGTPNEWNVTTSEYFARGFERYLAEGVSPSTILKSLFEAFKSWLIEIYNGITGSDIDVELNEAMRGIYSSMLGFERPKPTIVSYFSGSGTMEAAFGGDVRSGLAVEFSPEYIKAYNKAFGKDYEPRDVNEVSPQEIKDIDPLLFHASPVCKNYSLAKDPSQRGTTDLDIKSAKSVAAAISTAKPPIVTIENVGGYKGDVPYNIIIEALEKAGYKYDANIYDVADYGAVQTRKRVLIRAIREGELPPFPDKIGPKDWYSAIEDLIPNAPDHVIGKRAKRNIDKAMGRKNFRDLYRVNRELFGLNQSEAMSAAIAMDKMIGVMANRAGVSKTEMYGRLNFKKATEGFAKDLSNRGKLLFQLIGENAELSQEVRNNLQTARVMEAAGESVKSIRLRTGWERGKDGKWRYEIDDSSVSLMFNMKSMSQLGKKYNLDSVLNYPELFSAYPELRKVKISISKKGGSTNEAFFDGKQIVLGIGTYDLSSYIEKLQRQEFLRNVPADILEVVNAYFENEQLFDELRKQGFSFDEALDAKMKKSPFNDEVDKMLLKSGYGETNNLFGREFITPNQKFFEIIRAIEATKKEEDRPSEFNLDLNKDLLLTTLHEIQHWIQKKEGFARGGNMVLAYEQLSAGEKSIYDDLQKKSKEKLDELDSKSLKWYEQGDDIRDIVLAPQNFLNEAYRKIAGEVEARNVEGRFGMTPEQRRATTLQETEDVARDEQMVLFEKAVPQGVKFQVDAWHGSPYQFDKFTTEKIGTGEGAQAFGWGLYFTDLKGIAENYANELSPISTEYLLLGENEQLLRHAVLNNLLNKDVSEVLESYYDRHPILRPLPESEEREIYGEEYDVVIKNRKENIDVFNARKNEKFETGRNLYRVSLHKGKTPDQYTWLEWDKYATEQQKKQIADNIPELTEEDKKVISKYFTEKGNLKSVFLGQEYKNILPKYELNLIKERLLKDGTRLKGSEIYNQLERYFGGFNARTGFVKGESGKQASLFLLEAGIDGIKYPAESIARGATSDTARGYNYVVFDENAVSIEETIKFQKDAVKARGAMMITLDGQATIYALTDPDVSTPLHELAHVFEHYLTDEERTTVQEWAKTEVWTMKTSEDFARGFEKYLSEGQAPTPALQKIFDNFKQWLTDIYKGIVGSSIDIELNKPMRDLYAKMLGQNALVQQQITDYDYFWQSELGQKIQKRINIGYSRGKRGFKVNRNQIKLYKSSLPIIVMGEGQYGPMAANSGGPAPTLISSSAQTAFIVLPETKQLKVLTPRMMARIMDLPDTYTVPSDYKTAKEVLGNGMSGVLTRQFIMPLIFGNSVTLAKNPNLLFQQPGAKQNTFENDGTMLNVDANAPVIAGSNLPPAVKKATAETDSEYYAEYRASDLIKTTHAPSSAFVGLIRSLSSGQVSNPKITINLPFENKNVTNKIDQLTSEYQKLGDKAANKKRKQEITEELNKITKDYMGEVVKKMTLNILALYDTLTPAFIQRARNWYVGANRIANTMASKYGLSLEQTAGILAVFSPKTDWQINVSHAERLIDIIKNYSDLKVDKNFIGKVRKKIEGMRKGGVLNDKDEEFLELLSNATSNYPNGMSINEMSDIGFDESTQGLLVRAIMTEKFPKTYAETYPEGDLFRKAKKAYAESSYDFMGKAIRIYRNNSLGIIHEEIGDANKVRNFYNNIVDPFSPVPYVTGDTHAIAAAMGMPLAADDAGLLKLFVDGISPMYTMLKEAYIAATEVVNQNDGTDFLPREMQSIIWEAIRMGMNELSPNLRQELREELVKNKKENPYEKTRRVLATFRQEGIRTKNPEWGGPGFSVQVSEILRASKEETVKRVSQVMAVWRQLRGGRGGNLTTALGGEFRARLNNFYASFLASRGDVSRSLELARFLNKAFPGVSVFVDKTSFQEVMREPGTKKFLNKNRKEIYGVTINGRIYINPDQFKSDVELMETMIHEFGHIWVNYIKVNNRELYDQGVKLAKEEHPELYQTELLKNKNDKERAIDETLATLIGKKGQSEGKAMRRGIAIASGKDPDKVEDTTVAGFSNWLNKMWEYVRKEFRSLRGLSVEEIQNITLTEFIDGALFDLFSGEPVPQSQLAFENSLVQEPQFNSSTSMYDLINQARNDGYRDAEIRRILEVNGFAAEDINEALKVYLDVLTIMPSSFAQVPGGAFAGQRMYESLMADVQAYAKTGVKSAQVREYAQNKLKDQQLFKDSTEFQRMAMMVDLDKSINISANKAITAEMRKIRAAIAGIKKGKSQMSAIQRSLIAFIKKSLPVSTYEKKDVVDLIRKIQALDLNNIDQIKREVFDYVTRFRIKNEKERLQTLLSTKLAKLESSRLKGLMSVEFQQRFSELKSNLMGESDALTNPSKVEDKIAELNVEFLDVQNQVFAQGMNELWGKMEDLQFAIQYNSTLLLDDDNPNKLLSLEELVEKVDALISAERSSFKDFLKSESERYNEMKNYLLYDISSGKYDINFNNKEEVENAIAQIQNDQLDEKKRNWFMAAINRIVSVLDLSVLNTEDLDSVIDRISKATGQLFGGIAQELIGQRIDDSRDNFIALRAMAKEMISQNAERIFGKNYRDVMERNSKKSVLVEINRDTTPVKLMELSQNEMYYLYNLYKDPANHPGFKTLMGNSYPEIMDEIIRQLDPQLKEWADWQVDEFYPAMYPIYNEVYKSIYRTNMPWNAHYAGRVFREGVPDFSTIDFLRDPKGFKMFAGGQSTKARVKNSAAIRPMDGDYVLRSYIKDMNFFAAFGEAFRDLSKLLNSPLIRKAMDAFVGEDVRKYLGLQQGEEKGGVLDAVLSANLNRSNEPAILESITKGYVFAKLGINFRVFLYQTASFLNFTMFIGYRNYALFAAKAFGNLAIGGKSNAYRLFKEMYENSQYLRDREDTESILDLMAGFNSKNAKGETKSLLDRVTEGSVGAALMFMLRNGDKAGIAGSIPNYLYYKTEYANRYGVDIDSQEAIDYAIKKVNKQVRKVAQDNESENKSLLQSTGGAIAKGFYLFASQPLQLLRKEIRSVRNIYRILAGLEGAKGTFQENARVFITAHFVSPLVFQWLALGLPGVARKWNDDDEDELILAAIIGNLNQLFVLGQLLDTAKDAILKKPWAKVPETAVPYKIVTQLAVLMVDAINTKDADKRLDAQIKFSIAIAELSGIPAGTMLGLFKNYEKLLKGEVSGFGEAFLRMFNFPERQITGPKKEKNPYDPSSSSSKSRKSKNPYAP